MYDVDVLRVGPSNDQKWRGGVKEKVVGVEHHNYTPYTFGYNNNDEIKIQIQNMDAITLISDSILIVEGKAMKSDGSARTPACIPNNGFAFLFSEIRYEVNSTVVDYVRNPGIATSLKAYASMTTEDRDTYAHAGWSRGENVMYLNAGQNDWLIDENGNFAAWIPLKLLLGVAEDHHKIMLGVRQELALVRSRSDEDCLWSREEGAATPSAITIGRITWRVPHLRVSPEANLYLTKLLNSQPFFPVRYMHWDLNELPNLQQTKQHSWVVKSTTVPESPKFVILALQTDRRGDLKKIASEFDLCHLRTAKLFLNEHFIPYCDLRVIYSGVDGPRSYEHPNLNTPELFEMFRNFQRVYYGREPSSPITRWGLINVCPMVVFDCTHVPPATMQSSVDIRLEFETVANVPANTSAFCLILHEVAFEYSPLSAVVRKLTV